MMKLVILRIVESFFRHRWLYFFQIVLILGAAFYFSFTPEYIAKGVLYVQNESFLAALNSVDESSATWWASPAATVTSELNELLQTDAFIRAVIQQTDLEKKMGDGDAVVTETIEEVREAVWVSALGDNQLSISAAFPQPKVTYQLVNGVIDAFIQWQINAKRTESEAAQKFFAELIQEYDAELGAARQEMKDYLITHPEPLHGDRPAIEQLEVDNLQARIDLAATRYSSALDKEENSRLALAQIESNAHQTYQLIDAAKIPMKPEFSLKDMAVRIGIFSAAGLLLLLGAVVGGALLDRSFLFPVHVSHGIDLEVLAAVPDVRPRLRWYQRRSHRPKKAVDREARKAAKALSAGAEEKPQQGQDNGPGYQQAGAELILEVSNSADLPK